MPAKKLSGTHAHLYGGSGEGRGFATSPGIPVKPDWIAAKPIASQMWDETLAELAEVPGMLSSLDRDALALYADLWQTFHDGQALIAKHGYVATSEKGGAYQHPAVGVCNKAREQLIKIGAMFGLNPTARDGMVLRDVVADELEGLLR